MTRNFNDPARRKLILFVTSYFISNNSFGLGEGGKELPLLAWTQISALPAIDVKELKDDRVQLLIFFDPNCPICADLWVRLYGKESIYKSVSSRWIPVAYMSKQSLPKAIGLLASGSPDLLAANFVGFDRKLRQGAAAEAKVTPEMTSNLAAGQRHWEHMGSGTPLIVYRTKDGAVRSQLGLMPQTVFSEMILNLRDARLDKFK
jgi:hypothetical protein